MIISGSPSTPVYQESPVRLTLDPDNPSGVGREDELINEQILKSSSKKTKRCNPIKNVYTQIILSYFIKILFN